MELDNNSFDNYSDGKRSRRGNNYIAPYFGASSVKDFCSIRFIRRRFYGCEKLYGFISISQLQ